MDENLLTQGENQALAVAEKPTEVVKPQGAPTIDGGSLGTQAEFTLPAPIQLNNARNTLGATVEPVEVAEAPEAVEEAPRPQDALVERIMGNIEQSRTRGERTSEILVDEGVKERREELNRIQDDLRRTDAYYRRLEEDLMAQGGGLQSGAMGEVNTIRRNANREKADLRIQEQAALDSYNTAYTIAQDKIDAEFEPLQQEIQNLTAVYNLMQNDLTESEKLQVQAKIDQKKNDTETAQELALSITNQLIDADAYTPDKARALNKALTEATQAISEGNSPTEALGKIQALMSGVETKDDLLFQAQLDREKAGAAASWALATERLSGGGGTVTTATGEVMPVPSFDEWANENGGRVWHVGGTPAQMEELREEYDAEMEMVRRANALNTVSPLAREVLKNPKGYFDLTPTKRGEILKELAEAGIDTASLQDGNKKKLSATQVDDLAQAQLAKRNVVELYDMLKQVPGTGPIAGRLKALNPYDPLVADIKAQINRTVPGLARGIFKEVGVLTDADVNRYSQTLANFNFTDSQIEQLHSSTLGLIDDSIRMTTSLYDDLGYDLGDFDVNEATSSDGLSDDEAWEEYQKLVNSNQ